MKSLRQKLKMYNKMILDRDTLDRIIRATSPTMTINDASTMGYVDPIKRGTSYRNNLGTNRPNNFVIGGQYVEFSDYMMGGMRVYNMYGFTTQLAEQTDIYTFKYSRMCLISGDRYIFHKIKKPFLYGIVRRKMQGYYVNFMTPERAFIEYVRERILQPEKDFVEICAGLDHDKLINMAHKYPLKNVRNTLARIQSLCISQK